MSLRPIRDLVSLFDTQIDVEYVVRSASFRIAVGLDLDGPASGTTDQSFEIAAKLDFFDECGKHLSKRTPSQGVEITYVNRGDWASRWTSGLHYQYLLRQVSTPTLATDETVVTRT